MSFYSKIRAHCRLFLKVMMDRMHFHAYPLINSRYYYLAFRAHQMPETSKENAVAILERAKLENWVLGTTKVMQTLNRRRLCSKCNEIICGETEQSSL